VAEPRVDALLQESRAARRLGRLFRIERVGGFDRRPAATVRRLIERRGALLEELMQFENRRRSLAVPRNAELDRAVAELASELSQALNFAQSRVDRIGLDLRIRQGEGLGTGIRNNANGRMLGKI